jgi:hypothetical protein
MNGFIKYNRSEAAKQLQASPNANHLLNIIAFRASRTGNPVQGVKVGEALVGDFDKIGLKRQPFRTALANLQKWGYITTRTTNKGTFASLANTEVYDVNLKEDNQQPNQQTTSNPTNKQPATQPTANHYKEVKKKEIKKKEKSKKSTPKEVPIFLNDFKEDQQPGHQFPNIKARKSYKVETPSDGSDLLKPFEMFLNNYPFANYGWTKEIKSEFLIYCKIRDEGGKFSTTQIKLRLSEINEALKNHEAENIIMILKAAQNGKDGAWASFEFTERIKDRQKKAAKNQQKNKPNTYEGVINQLSDPNFLKL